MSTRGDSVIRAVAALVWLAALPLLWLGPFSSPGRLLGSLVGTYVVCWGVPFLLTSSPRVWCARFVVCTAAIVAVVAVIEVPAVLGVADYRFLFKTPLESPLRPATVVYDPELLHITRPHTRLTVRTAGDLAGYICPRPAPQRFEIRYDHLGFRNPVDLSRADVVLLGDSFLEVGRDEELVSAVLARLGRRTVANLGQIMYGPQQELAALRRFGVPLRPAVVVWMFFEGNDLEELRRYDADRAGLQASATAGDRYRFRSFTHSALMTGLALLRSCEALPRLRRQAGWLRDREGTERLMYFGYPARALSRADSAAIEKMATIVAEARRLAGDAQFVFAFIPTKYRVYHDLLRYEAGADADDWALNDLPQRMARLVKDVAPDAEYLDLTPPLRAAARSGELVYGLTDTHWSAAGHRVAAGAIAQVLR